jgi:hypothetical protein
MHYCAGLVVRSQSEKPTHRATEVASGLVGLLAS